MAMPKRGDRDVEGIAGSAGGFAAPGFQLPCVCLDGVLTVLQAFCGTFAALDLFGLALVNPFLVTSLVVHDFPMHAHACAALCSRMQHGGNLLLDEVLRVANGVSRLRPRHGPHSITERI